MSQRASTLIKVGCSASQSLEDGFGTAQRGGAAWLTFLWCRTTPGPGPGAGPRCCARSPSAPIAHAISLGPPPAISASPSGASTPSCAACVRLTAEQVALGGRLVAEGASVREVAKVILKCHPATLYRELGKLAPLTSAGDERVSSSPE